MTLVPASEKLEDKSTTSGLFVVRVTSRRLTSSARLGVREDETLPVSSTQAVR